MNINTRIVNQKIYVKERKSRKIFYTETQNYFLTNFNLKIQYNVTAGNSISNNIHVHGHSLNFLYQ